MIFDHCTHFSPESLQTLCHRAGLRTVIARTDWVPRETSALVASGATATPPHVDAASADLATQHLAWLRALAGGFRRLVAQPSPVGIFGSSIGATWLQHQNENGARFFVDEDSTRIGRRHCGTPIIGSDEVPADAIVVVALPEPLAQSIAQRLARSGVRYLTPAAVAAF
jgi:hypothetical protein